MTKFKIVLTACCLLILFTIFSANALASPGDYFFGWTNSYYEYNPQGGYNDYYKRSNASTAGYKGPPRHYLRTYVTNYSYTDTGRVWAMDGFSLLGTWAWQPRVPVLGVGNAFWGY